MAAFAYAPNENGAVFQRAGNGSASPGLLSRIQFIDRLERELRRTKNCLVDRYVVLCIDLDRFKVLNTSLGRSAGDDLLNAIADRLSAQLSHRDALARIGGDEFAVLVEETPDSVTAAGVAEAIQRDLISGFTIEGNPVYATASIGIVRVSSTYATPDDVLRDGEIAMYRAKEKGRARSEMFHPTMLVSAQDLFELETDLRGAVERNEFELYFQPIVSLKTGKVRAFESLLRWRHPSRGLQSPASFFSLLKETGLIVSVGNWVIEEACRYAKEWEDLRGKPIPVTINLTSQQFSHSSVINQVIDAIDKTGAHPGSLVLEITEDALLEDLDAARATLLPLRELGIRTMIDDFGTGYSSLSYLRRLPLDAIKIDSSFMDRIERFAEDRMIVRAIIALAHALDLCVVAEGMERPEQLTELIGLDCEEAQGYLISAPVHGAVATQMVASRWTSEVICNGQVR